ncbi:MAG: hypothetical protein ACXWUB_12000, partial [Burkholderiales bacterium]
PRLSGTAQEFLMPELHRAEQHRYIADVRLDRTHEDHRHWPRGRRPAPGWIDIPANRSINRAKS